jgi:hypothetical protein
MMETLAQAENMPFNTTHPLVDNFYLDGAPAARLRQASFQSAEEFFRTQWTCSERCAD